MDQTTVERIRDWEARSFEGGYRGLHALADDQFTGAVVAGSAWLFMQNGRVVGIADGALSAFEDASGTAYAAPHSSLPLLYFMQHEGGETRAKYYTNDTPLREVDDQLTSGNFSGYVELSDNVLSGDYYLVYYAGRSKAVAFVGNSGRMLTDDEAFDRAADEVGIYAVKAVDVDILDIPDVAEPDSASATVVDTDEAPAQSTSDSPDGADSTVEPADDAGATAGEAPPTTEETPTAPGTDAREPTESAAAASEEADAAAEDEEIDVGTESPGTTVDNADAASDDAEPTSPPDPLADPSETPPDSPLPDDREPAEVSRAPASGLSTRALETRSIPSLDPAKTDEGAGGRIDTANRPERTEQSLVRESSSRRPTGTPNAPPKQDPPQSPQPDSEVEDLRAALQNQKNEVARLETQLESVTDDREVLQAEREELEAEVSRLEAEVARLETLLDEARENGTAVGRDERMTPAEALSGTNLFVRYNSKSKTTLQSVLEGEAEAMDIVENLRIEYHTQFDAADVSVDGQQFEAFLTETVQYRFVEWLTRSLLFEIRDTGNEEAVRELFAAIPKIDRAELNAKVSIRYQQDGEEHREQLTFDVVLRDRMGNPLVVADFNDSRDPATESMLASLITEGSRVAETADSLSAAFFVTSSFYDPDALETASDATGGGLLSRDKRKSYVKLSRKQGYHLCLVEARGGEFYMNLPEL
ncbi:hypothetical protein [Haladaptatus sp. DYSN1]|uniref:DUF7527 domain-containing protein n=1 Tax=unclassified Haladaptatus TaxID=2622732 RepID=UPI0024069CAD|nr:hypothetical protein [Haladaptatus sp. DYSN1]